MAIQLHENQHGRLKLNGDLLEPFPITNSMKQGCILAPIIISMMLQTVTDFLDDEHGVYVTYNMDGSLLNLRRLQVHTKTQERLIRDLPFADDVALVAHTEQTL